METKALPIGADQIEIKDAEKGQVSVRFAKMNVKDHDGDLTERGAFGSQKVRVSAYGHSSWGGVLPVGAGTIKEKGDDAIADLQFFMDTMGGLEHFKTIRNLKEFDDSMAEWSYGFDVLESRAPSEDERQRGIFRVLQKLKVHEVSPVLLGAGVDTATLSVKGRDGEETRITLIIQGDIDPKVLAKSLKDGIERETKAEDEAPKEEEPPPPPNEQEQIAREVGKFEAWKVKNAR